MTKLGQKKIRHLARRASLFLALTATALWRVAPEVNAEAINGNCYRAWFTEKPRWIASTLARQEDPSLILVDSAQNKLLAYDQAGNSTTLGAFNTKEVVGFIPTAISQADGGELLLELVDGTVIQFDHDLGTAKAILSPQRKITGSIRVGSLYQWKLAGNSLIAYGSLVDDKDEVLQGFFRVPLVGVSPQIPEMLTTLQESDFYLIGNNYITTIGATAYYVSMGAKPAIFKASPGHGPEKLASFPEEFRNRPYFETKMTGPRSVAAHFAELETLAVASGLYSQDGFLYLLTRKPTLNGTKWTLHKIDPIGDRLIGAIDLPTSASHLSVAASRTKWFFIEKGRIRSAQQQEINSAIVINGSEILSLKTFPATCPKDPSSRGEVTLVNNFSTQNLLAIILIIVIGVLAITTMKSRFSSKGMREL